MKKRVLNDNSFYFYLYVIYLKSRGDRVKKFFNKKNILIFLLILCLIAVLKSPYTKEIVLYLFLFSTIISGSYTLSYFFKKKVEQTIPLYFLFMFLYLYIFGLFNILLIGYFSFLFFSIIFGVYSLFSAIKNGSIKDMNDLYNRPGLYIFSFLYFAFAYFTRNAAFYVWDEFTFWSIATKNMYYLNNFYALPGNTMHIFYPPSPTLFQYYFARTLMKYSQGIELYTSYMICFSLMLPLLKNISLKNHKMIFTIFLSMIIIPSIFCNNNFYQTIYVDVFLGLLAGYIFIEYYTENDSKYKMVELILGLIVLSSTKPTGFIMAGIIIFVLIIDNILKVNDNKLKINIPNRKSVFRLVILLIAIFSTFLSWKLYLKFNLGVYNNGYNHNMYQNTNTVQDMFKCIFDTTIGNGVPVNKTFRNFLPHMFETKMFINKPFSVSGSTLLCLFIIGFYYLYKRLNDDKNFFKKTIIYALYGIMYVSFIQVAYYLIFETAEAIAHASIERYIGTAWVTLILVLYGELFINKKINNNFNCVFTFFIGLLLFAPFNVIFDATLTSASHNAEMQAGISNQRDFANYVISRTTDSDRIFAIHQTQSQDSWLIQFRYFMTPRMIPLVDSFSDKNLYYFEKFNTVEDLQSELYEKYDYVVILVTDNYFNEHFSSIFENEKIDSWSLYKIVKNDDKTVMLKRVE